MVAARAEFLAAGHYEPIADAVARQVADGWRDPATLPAERSDAVAMNSGRPERTGTSGAAGVQDEVETRSSDSAGVQGDVVLDVGAGTGYYLGHTLDKLAGRRDETDAGVIADASGRAGSHGVAMDVSAYALRRAAKAHPRIAAIGADVWDALPLRDGSVSAILDVFAPRNAAEFHRVLRPGGTLVVVTPSPGHLAELVDRFGMLSVDERKDERIEETLAESFILETRAELTHRMSLAAHDIGRLIRMGPSAHHIDTASLEETLDMIDAPLGVTAAVTVARYSARF